MPVEDIEVHEKVKKVGFHEHCHNNRKPTADGYYAQDRHYYADGTWRNVMAWVPNTFSTLCRAKGGYPSPPGCVGCKHDGEDIEFEQRAEARK